MAVLDLDASDPFDTWSEQAALLISAVTPMITDRVKQHHRVERA